MTGPAHGLLPYLDRKPHGAADFYFAINATFAHILRDFGEEGWREYLQEMGRTYYAPVNRSWQEGGIASVGKYWEEFFRHEPAAKVEVLVAGDSATVNVGRCPAIHHLRSSGRRIEPRYCEHCYWLGSARAEESGLFMTLEGGNGRCVHTYSKAPLPPQQAGSIRKVTP
jgi:hypothetical protein